MAEPPSSSSTPAATVAVSLSKQGHAPDENEDACAVQTDAWPLRMVVADGATESVYAGLWAKLCAEGFATLHPHEVRSHPGGSEKETSGATGSAWREALAAWQSQWQDTVDRRSADAPWYVAEKQRQGAFATVLALTVYRNGTYRVASVGDCLLAVQPLDGNRRTWPVDQPDAFTNRPALLPSRPEADVPPIEHTIGTWTPGDRFVLATDAVAEWLLRTAPDAVFTGDLPDETYLHHQLTDARNAGDLRNDDLTLTILHMDRLES